MPEFIEGGTITSPQGFLAGATSAGIKGEGLDLGILYSEVPAVSVGFFTKNRVKAAPLLITMKRLPRGRAVVVNSGCANAGTGRRGIEDAILVGKLAAAILGIKEEEVLLASTGVIGEPLPILKIRDHIGEIRLTKEGGHDFARAIMTTDRAPKEGAVSIKAGGREVVVGGVAKGAGMIHPELATMLCFITTDAFISKGDMRKALKKAIDLSFNSLTVDGETSPNDMVILTSNGLSGVEPPPELFEEALIMLCEKFARDIARGAEGATKLIEVEVSGARNDEEARLLGRRIASSPLFKSAVHGGDPNWGRILSAIGSAGFEDKGLSIKIGDAIVFRDGEPLDFDREKLRSLFSGEEVKVSIELKLGRGRARVFGCDLSEEYVKINSRYTT